MNDAFVLNLELTVSSGISLCADTIVLSFYFCNTRLHVPEFHMIMMLIVADLEWSLVNLIMGTVNFVQTSESIALCNVTLFLQGQSALSSAFWSLMIAFALQQSAHNPQTSIKVTKRKYAMGFVLPAALAIIPLIVGDLQQSKVFGCQISDQSLIYYFFLPLWVSIVANTLLILMTIRYMRQIMLSIQLTGLFSRLLAYPIILTLCWIPATLLVLFQWQLLWLTTLSFVMEGSIGLLDAIAYGYQAMQQSIRWQNGRFTIKQLSQDEIVSEGEQDYFECASEPVYSFESSIANQLRFRSRNESNQPQEIINLYFD